MVSDIVLSSQKGSFGVGDALASAGQSHLSGKHIAESSIEYVKYVLSRGKVYNATALGISSDLTLFTYMLCGLSVLFFLLCSLPFASYLIKKDLALEQLLWTRHCSPWKQILCEWSVFFLFLTIPAGFLLLVLGQAQPLASGAFFTALPAFFALSAMSFFLFRLSRDLCLVLLYLEVEVVSEDLLVPHDRFFRTLHVSGYDRSRNLSRDTCRTAYESFGILLHDLMADARLLVVFTLDMTGRNDLHEVLVAVVVLCQEDEVVVASVVLVLELVVVVLGHIDLAADDRLDLGELLRHLEKLLDTIHVSMVCDGQGRHFELFCTRKEVTDSRLAVKDGILCMYVKVDEGHISGF